MTAPWASPQPWQAPDGRPWWAMRSRAYWPLPTQVDVEPGAPRPVLRRSQVAMAVAFMLAQSRPAPRVPAVAYAPSPPWW